MFQTFFLPLLSFILIQSIPSCKSLIPEPNFNQKFKINIAASPSSDLPTITPQLEHAQLAWKYTQTVTKRIVLDDGRILKCHIPLSVSTPSHPSPTEYRNLTEKEIEPLFIHLKDVCTQHRTKYFLWEFCFEKYVRQYDDESTKRNAQKPAFELFFLGFYQPSESSKYMLQIKDDVSYIPEREYNQLPIRQEIANYDYLQTHGRVARVMNSPTNYNPKWIYSVYAYVPVDQLGDDDIIDSSGSTKKTYKHTFMSESILKQGFYKVERTISKVLSPHILLLDEPFPFDIATDQVKIHIKTGLDTLKPNAVSPTKVLTPNNRYVGVSGTYLYGSIEFLSDTKPFTTVLLEINDSEFVNRVIVEAIDDYIVRLDEPVSDAPEEIIQHTIFLGTRPEVQSLVWTQKKGRVYAMGTVVLGKETSFKTDFERGDSIMLIDEPDLFTNGRAMYLLEVLEVKSDTLMKVRSSLLSPKQGMVGSTDVYLVGKYKDLEGYGKQFIKPPQKEYRKESISHINTDAPNSLLFRKYEEELKEDVLLCNNGFYFPDPKSWLLSFTPLFL